MTSRAQVLTGNAIKANGEVGAAIAWSLEGLTNNAGRVSAQYDLGASPRNFEFEWNAQTEWQATPTQYGTLDFYIAVALDNDATKIPGDVGNADAALGDIDQLRNLQYIGSIVVEDANTTVMRGSGSFRCRGRYLTLVAVNRGGSTLHATDANSVFNLLPVVIQGQDS